jgi:hypothetical protein
MKVAFDGSGADEVSNKIFNFASGIPSGILVA